MKNNQMGKLKKVSFASLACPLALAGVLFTSSSLPAASFNVTIAPTNMDLVAYCFNTNDLAHALPNAPDFTTVYIWNWGNQNYDICTYFGGAWSPGYTLFPGQGFFIENPQATNFTFTVQGTPLTASSYTLHFPVANNLYAVGTAYNINVGLTGENWLSCQLTCNGFYQY